VNISKAENDSRHEPCGYTLNVHSRDNVVGGQTCDKLVPPDLTALLTDSTCWVKHFARILALVLAQLSCQARPCYDFKDDESEFGTSMKI